MINTCRSTKIIKYYQNENGKPADAVLGVLFNGFKTAKAQKLFAEKDKWNDILFRYECVSKIVKQR